MTEETDSKEEEDVTVTLNDKEIDQLCMIALENITTGMTVLLFFLQRVGFGPEFPGIKAVENDVLAYNSLLAMIKERRTEVDELNTRPSTDQNMGYQ